jgi:hypothetical protein
MRNNYIDILQNKVEIPIIQRDYAQGRTDSKTNKIRKDFLDAIFEFIQQKQQNPALELDLDFIYGLNKSSAFVPIDGQQRLTTLWLLYWFVAVKENIEQDKKDFLKNFVYETRHSTTQFCKNLIPFVPEFSGGQISNEIKNQHWYFDTWNYDPGIRAMMVVLDDIEKRYKEQKFASLWDLIGSTSCPFYFYKLDMDKVGLSDDLYIKMNSRGKPLTEFEYFKAGFTELLKETKQREKFETCMDGIWMDTIWQMVFEHCDEEDIALAVDQAFLNLFNFISSMLSFKQEIKTEEGDYYESTESTPELLKQIYCIKENQDFLFETLDSICKLHTDFWDATFYYGKEHFEKSKTRLYFLHGETNLLQRCLFHFDELRGLSFPERVMLSAIFTHFRNQDEQFERHIRVVRNLAINSEFELRETSLGKAYSETEQYIQNGDLNVFTSFKTDQIEEEKQKETHLLSDNKDTESLRQLEDSDIFRGSITLIPLDDKLQDRASKFLTVFDEDDLANHYEERCNLLLCFGDYSQADGELYNLLPRNKRDIRKFLTTPGYNKKELYSATQKVVTNCLDFFINNESVSVTQRIAQTTANYEKTEKDWPYYFLKYPSFREHCHYGYYSFSNNYPNWKMGKKQFNGYHWNPFLHEVLLTDESKKIALGNYGSYDKLMVSKNRTKVQISALTQDAGFLFENGNTTTDDNSLLQELIENGWIDEEQKLIIEQNNEGIDMVDRVEKLKSVLEHILS